jgi:hypothetical protein
VVFATYLGGTGTDYCRDVKADSSGHVYAYGWTSSTDFPTANAYQISLMSGEDAWLAKLSADGSSLLYSTYLGGSGTDRAYSLMALDSTNRVLIGG